MALVEIVVRSRAERGSAPAGRLRKQGWVPAVIYGHGKAAESLAVERRVIEKVINAHHRVIGLQTESGGAARRALIKEVQYNPITDQVVHVDFVEVFEHETIEVTVPLVFRGEAAGLKDGGAVETLLHEIVVGCPADHVIEEHRVDVSSLAVGDTIYVRDLVLPTGIVMVSDTDLAVVGCRMHRADVPEPVAPGVPVEGEAAPAQPEVIAEKKREEREKTKEEE